MYKQHLVYVTTKAELTIHSNESIEQNPIQILISCNYRVMVPKFKCMGLS